MKPDESAAERSGPYSVLYASQRRLLILGVKGMCEAFDEIEFVGAAVDPSSLMAHLRRRQIDILLLSWGQYGGYGMETFERIAALESPPKVVVMAESPDPDAIRDSLLHGASGFISEGCDDTQFADALISVGEGRIVIETGARRGVRDGLGNGTVAPEMLTERERGVLTLIASGLSTKQIATALFLSPKTVETHRTNLMRKLDLVSVADVVRYAITTGMLASLPPEEPDADRNDA